MSSELTVYKQLNWTDNYLFGDRQITGLMIEDGRLHPGAVTLANSIEERCLMSDWRRHLGNWMKHTNRL